MYKKRFCIIVFTLVMTVFLAFGCSEDEEKDSGQTDIVIKYNLSGSVVDENGAAVPDVSISYTSGSATGQATTDASGNYRFTDLIIGEYTIDASKSGYTFGRTVADITEEGAIVSNIVIKTLATKTERVEEVFSADTIQTLGASVSSSVESNISTGSGATEKKSKVASASIPSETVITINDVVQTDDVSLAVTPMDVDEVPPPPEDEMPMGAAIFEPADAKFDKEVDVKLPVEIQLPAGLSIPVKKYENGAWKDVGSATIDATGLGADAKVTEFGQIAVQPKVTVDQQASEPEETEGEESDIAEGQTVVEAEVTDEVELTDLPNGVSQEYALSLIEKMKGITIGASRKVKLELPSVSKPVAKVASPLSAEKTEPWKQTCKLVVVDKVTTESITLNIDVGSTTVTITISYKYTKKSVKTRCTQSWVEHGQGGV